MLPPLGPAAGSCSPVSVVEITKPESEIENGKLADIGSVRVLEVDRT
ncbi:hypothetical protein [Streptomyces sp. NRRL S-1868]|nr:hypothetical protein [Streptomyces sp. NRRL S-1868]